MRFGKRLLRHPKASSSSSSRSTSSKGSYTKPFGSTGDVSVTDEPSATEGEDFPIAFSTDDYEDGHDDVGPVSVDAFYSEDDDNDDSGSGNIVESSSPNLGQREPTNISSRDSNAPLEDYIEFMGSSKTSLYATSFNKESRNDYSNRYALGKETADRKEHNGSAQESVYGVRNSNRTTVSTTNGVWLAPEQLNSQGVNQAQNPVGLESSSVNAATLRNRTRGATAFHTELYSTSMRSLVLELDEALAEVESTDGMHQESEASDSNHDAQATNVNASFVDKDDSTKLNDAAKTSPTAVHELSAFDSPSFRTNSMRGLVRELDDALAEVESRSELLTLPEIAAAAVNDAPQCKMENDRNNSAQDQDENVDLTEQVIGGDNNDRIAPSLNDEYDGDGNLGEENGIVEEGSSLVLQSDSAFRTNSFRSDSLRELARELDEELTGVESKNEILSLRQELAQVQERLNQALVQIQQQNECIDDANKEISFLEHLVDEKDLELEKANTVINRLVSELMQAEEEIERAVQREREQHGNIVAEINCQMTEQKAEMDTIREEFQQKIAALNCKIADQCSQIEDWKEEVLQKTTALAAAEARCSALEKKFEDKPKGVWHLASAAQVKNALMHG